MAIAPALAITSGSNPSNGKGQYDFNLRFNEGKVTKATTEADAPIIKLVHQMILEAIQRRASDIHVEPLEKRLRVRYRVDGVLIVDYPPEECVDFAASLRAHAMDLIFLLAPTSTDKRMQQVAAVASGYVYYVSLKGVTGAGHLDTAAVEAMLPRIRQHVNTPVGVGFGIRDAATAKAVAAVSDAIVIGSRIIQVLEETPPEKAEAAVQAFLSVIRKAIDE